jgi:hypothetical protein
MPLEAVETGFGEQVEIDHQHFLPLLIEGALTTRYGGRCNKTFYGRNLHCFTVS